jgi:RNA polymerase sigma factor (sigma-70 family)
MGIEIVSKEIDQKAVSLTELIQTTRSRLLAYARSRLVEDSAAEDLVQEACLSAWTSIDAVLESPNPPGWLMNALKIHIRRYYADIAKDNKLSDALAASADGEPLIADDADSEISFAAALTDDELHIVSLRAQGYSDREIADIVKTEYAAIRKRFSRIREKIKRFME